MANHPTLEKVGAKHQRKKKPECRVTRIPALVFRIAWTDHTELCPSWLQTSPYFSLQDGMGYMTSQEATLKG